MLNNQRVNGSPIAGGFVMEKSPWKIDDLESMADWKGLTESYLIHQLLNGHINHCDSETQKLLKVPMSSPFPITPNLIPISHFPRSRVRSPQELRATASLACFTFPAWGPRTFMALAALSERPRALSSVSTFSSGPTRRFMVPLWSLMVIILVINGY